MQGTTCGGSHMSVCCAAAVRTYVFGTDPLICTRRGRRSVAVIRRILIGLLIARRRVTARLIDDTIYGLTHEAVYHHTSDFCPPAGLCRRSNHLRQAT